MKSLINFDNKIRRGIFKLIFHFLNVGLVSFFCSHSWARIVESSEEALRLNGYQSHLEQVDLENKFRLKDVDEVKEKRKKWEELQNKALEEYRLEKAKRPALKNESSPEYKEDLERRKKALEIQEKEREAFVLTRDKLRNEFQGKVHLSEEEELQVIEKRERTPWQKRSFVMGKSRASGGSGSGSGSGGDSTSGGGSGGGGRFDDYQPPTSPPQDYYEEPPPPPPPPIFDGGGSPPSGGFDENVAPPIFDDSGPVY